MKGARLDPIVTGLAGRRSRRQDGMNFQYPVLNLRKMYTAFRVHYILVKHLVRNPSRCFASCLLIHM